MQSAPQAEHPVAPRLVGTGEMPSAIRVFPWHETPLGPIESWPDTLVATVNLILSLPYPAMILWGPDMVMAYNDAFAPIVADRHPAIGRLGRDFWTDAWPTVGAQLESVLRDGKSFLFEHTLVPLLRNGILTDAFFDYAYSPIFDSAGSVCGILVVCQEVTSAIVADHERSAALGALHAERSRLFNILQQAPIFFALLQGPDHVFTITNPAYVKLIGNREVLGKSLAEALPEVVPQGYLDMLNSVYATGVPVSRIGARVEFETAPTELPEVRFVDFTYQPLREADSTISGIMVLGTDITEKKHSEKALLQNEKLAAVGRLASTIAHEINNPLESVTNLIFLARRTEDIDQAHEYIDLAELELRRMSSIARQTLSFNKQSSAPHPVSCDDLFLSVTSIYQSRMANRGVSLEKDCRAVHPVVCNDGEIRQVLNNLVANAIDAMPHGGRLVIRGRDAIHPLTGRPGLRIAIADTGTGIAPEILRRIYEPFFTTKELGGTGLGLWLSRDIITRHHGSLHVCSSVSPSHHGTVFTVFLPRLAAPPAAALLS